MWQKNPAQNRSTNISPQNQKSPARDAGLLLPIGWNLPQTPPATDHLFISL
jgi:hypothetical protein